VVTQHSSRIFFRTAGTYCSYYQQRTTIPVYPPGTQSADLAAACYPNQCSWDSTQNYCSILFYNVYDSFTSRYQSVISCVEGCVTTSPCINGANAVYLDWSWPYYDGINAITADSCPIQCNAGFMLSGTYCVAQPPCLSCAAGTYSMGVGNSAPWSTCYAGSYQPGGGITGCSLCQAGSYTNTSGYTACLQCQTGQYQQASNASFCGTCASGLYANATGASSFLSSATGQ